MKARFGRTHSSDMSETESDNPLKELASSADKAEMSKQTVQPSADTDQPEASSTEFEGSDSNPKATEIGGPSGPEPTRYGDWERNGRCFDF